MDADMLLLVSGANGALPYIAKPQAAGISAYAFHSQSGATSLLATCGEVLNPTFIAVSPDRRLIAAVTERGDSAFGTVTTLTLDRQSGRMATVAAGSSLGSTPAHVSFDGAGRRVAAANYSAAPVGQSAGASVVVHEVGADGAFGTTLGSITHEGHGPDAGRQERSHAHCARWSADGRFLFVVDLGIDALVTYAVSATGLTKVASFSTPGGAGPRHLALHPNGRWAYLVAELNSTLLSLTLNADGSFGLLGSDTTLPPGGAEGSTCSAVQVTPDGRYVFAGNRGHDSIARFTIGADGVARFGGTTPSDGHIPRDMTVDPTGSWLAVANQESNHVSLFRLTDGVPRFHARIATGSPTCVAFVRR